MSSSLTASVRRDAPAIELHPAETSDETDRSYLHAITIGSIAGIIVFIALLWAVVKMLAPDWSVGATGVIAVWTGLWCGLFLGGTIAVGRWSQRNGH